MNTPSGHLTCPTVRRNGSAAIAPVASCAFSGRGLRRVIRLGRQALARLRQTLRHTGLGPRGRRSGTAIGQRLTLSSAQSRIPN